MTAARIALVATIALCCASLVPPAAAQHSHEHHDQQSAAVQNLQLDAGRKWATDAALRAGMSEIRAAFDADHPAIHAGSETDAQYAALADEIQSLVNRIVEQCQLPPAADANLHYVIADLSQGVSLMRGQDPERSRHDGAALVHGALVAYGQYFDDPDWSAGAAAKQ